MFFFISSLHGLFGVGCLVFLINICFGGVSVAGMVGLTIWLLAVTVFYRKQLPLVNQMVVLLDYVRNRGHGPL